MTSPATGTRSVQRCADCAREIPESAADVACPSCGGLLEIQHDFRGAGPAIERPSPSGVWRFRDLVLPSADQADIVSYPEGNTPLIESKQVARWTGIDAMLLKHEGFNPTGSFKDRGMTVGVTQARRIGARGVICASTGNTSASLAAYAARGELPAVVLVPAEHVTAAKLGQTAAYGALVLAVRGGFDDCLKLARAASATLGLYLLNSINPFRVEGQKTIVFEMLAQLDWDAPDWIAVPAGNLGNTAAFGKALREAMMLGLISRVPRLLAVQASGAAPFARAFREQFAHRHEVTPETGATAIRIGAPASWDRAVRAIRETDGIVTAVSDAEIFEAKATIDRAGVGCEPASAAAVAGTRALVRDGLITPGQRVVTVLTGHLLKDVGDPAAPLVIDNSTEAVCRVLEGY